ncbi:MAG: polyprenyl synthetase family protein [Cyanobacteria bacterium]|nr:polyprenyl synthetase family protein [Cyanobacteriota bacterium]
MNLPMQPPASLLNMVNSPAKDTVKTSIQAVYAPVSAALEQVKQRLLAVQPPESVLLHDSLHHALSGEGKLVRPVLTMLMGGATASVNSDENKKESGISDALIETAVVSEMIHIATLLHDDVLDDSDLRRGRPTVKKLWGNTISILSGDYLLAKASLKLSEIGIIRLVAIYSHVLADLCDGEVEQIRGSFALDDIIRDPQAAWASYYRKSLCKTSSLFSAGCEAAGILNGCDEAKIQTLRAFGENYGTAFQLIDDLLDYTGDAQTMGKPVLDDLRNGLLNAPILGALTSTSLTETVKEQLQNHIRQVFDNREGDGNKQEASILAILDLLKEHGCLDETARLAEEKISAACASIDWLPASDYKQALLLLAKNTILRRS